MFVMSKINEIKSRPVFTVYVPPREPEGMILFFMRLCLRTLIFLSRMIQTVRRP